MTKCVPEDGFKDSRVLKIVKTCKNISMIEFTVKEVIVFRVVTFLNEALREIQFLKNLRNIQRISNSTNYW